MIECPFLSQLFDHFKVDASEARVNRYLLDRVPEALNQELVIRRVHHYRRTKVAILHNINTAFAYHVGNGRYRLVYDVVVPSVMEIRTDTDVLISSGQRLWQPIVSNMVVPDYIVILRSYNVSPDTVIDVYMIKDHSLVLRHAMYYSKMGSNGAAQLQLEFMFSEV